MKEITIRKNVFTNEYEHKIDNEWKSGIVGELTKSNKEKKTITRDTYNNVVLIKEVDYYPISYTFTDIKKTTLDTSITELNKNIITDESFNNPSANTN